jgi:hypothetical protein
MFSACQFRSLFLSSVSVQTSRKVKLVQILNIKGQKSKCEKRCVPLGCPWSHTAFSLLNDLFFLDKYLILYCHILFFFGEEVEAFDPRQAFDHPRQDRPA